MRGSYQIQAVSTNIGKIFVFNKTRLLGRLAPMFFFNCEHFLFELCCKTKSTVRGFKKFYENLMTFEFCWRVIFEILIFHKPSLGICEVPQKIRAGWVQPF